MLKNYLKTAFRTLTKNRIYATINISGLTIGLCACMLVSTVVLDDLSYDNFWNRTADLYKVNMSNKMGDGIFTQEAYTPVGLGTELKERFPEMEQFANISSSTLNLKLADTASDGVSIKVLMADSTAKEMFDFDAIMGQPSPHVAGQANLLISESFCKKYFKGENPVGKVLYDVPAWQSAPQPYLITAVIKDIPQNTHLRAEAVVLNIPRTARIVKNRGTSMAQMYFMLKKGTDRQAFTDKVNAWYAEHMEYEADKVKFGLQPIREVYLNSDFDGYLEIKSTRKSVYIFGAVGIFLLLIACINFVNLSTARAIHRLKETGVRKILGAGRQQLIWQFLVESLLFFGISTLLAFLIYALAIPPVESFLGRGLTHTALSNATIFAPMLLVIFGVSVITGVYPAWLMSGSKPADSLSGRIFSNEMPGAGTLRKGLVVLQFSLAVVVMVALFVVRMQLHYMEKKDLGYNPDNLLYISGTTWEGKQDAFKAQLLQLASVSHASLSAWDPRKGEVSGSMTVAHPQRESEQIQINFLFTDTDFIETIGLQPEKGRLLSSDFGVDGKVVIPSDSAAADRSQTKTYQPVIITATTAKLLDVQHLGVPIKGTDYQAEGIVKDFHNESLHHVLGPLFMANATDMGYVGMFIRVAPKQEHYVLAELQALWKSFYPDKLLQTAWVSDILKQQYEAEQRQKTLFTSFSSLMLFLSALGVFGLIVHITEQRVKEIGIRKVLGASVFNIAALVSKGFVKLVLFAVVIASPIAWWTMNNWLADFAYRIDIEWWVFAAAGLAAVLIALLTISGQAIRAAMANPVDSLRDE